MIIPVIYTKTIILFLRFETYLKYVKQKTTKYHFLKITLEIIVYNTRTFYKIINFFQHVYN